MSQIFTASLNSPLSQASLPTTDGAIALLNLTSQIEGQLRQFGQSQISAAQGAGLVELFAIRGQFLSRIVDYEHASKLAEQLVQNVPTDANSFFARARTRAIFHRFPEALSDLNRAEQLGRDRNSVNAARAAILHAIGDYEQAFVIRQQAVETSPNIDTFGALAILQFERGDLAEAERLLIAAQECYCGISPFPIAWLYFQWGHLWMHAGNRTLARTWFEAANHRFPLMPLHKDTWQK